MNDPTYKSWWSMMHRCFKDSDKKYIHYGGRGITVCDWLKSSFRNLIALIGERPTGLILDRIDNEGNYSCGQCDQCLHKGWPKNIQWVTYQQSNRNRRSNKIVTYNGKTQCLQAWSEELGLAWVTLDQRIKKGRQLDINYKGGKLWEINGEIRSVAGWARHFQVSYSTFYYRILHGNVEGAKRHYV